MSKPHGDVYTVINGASADQKGRWVRIGATFLNKDGSESVLLDALPVNGKLQLHTPNPKENAGTDLRFVQDWIGHASIRNTVIYAQLTSRRRDEEARKVFASP